MIKSRQKFSFWLIAGLCLLIVAYVSLKAQEKEKGLDLTQALQNSSVQEIKVVMDSVYAEINVSYASVQSILKNSCYDCHSDKTNYPWYYKIPTINSMIDSDIKEGREHIDFSNGFPFGGSTDQLKLLRELKHEVGENDMPLLSYRIMHWGTTIEDERQDSLFVWVDGAIGKLEAMYQSLGIPYASGTEKTEENADDED